MGAKVPDARAEARVGHRVVDAKNPTVANRSAGQRRNFNNSRERSFDPPAPKASDSRAKTLNGQSGQAGAIPRISFERVNRAALPILPILLARWLPGGRIAGAEYTAINPRRADSHPGSFKVNLRTGRWADFAIERARGGDVVSLAAYLGGHRAGGGG